MQAQMCAIGNNSFTFEITPNTMHEPASSSSARQQVSNRSNVLLLSPETFIGLELSIVMGVERVYVDRIERGTTMRVMIMVNDRNAQLRREVYAREQAIIDAHPRFEFDFYLHPLMGRNPEEVVDGIGKLAYKRFQR